jgi:hypothetical protein
MKKLGVEQGFVVYWYPDTGGVYVGHDRAGEADDEKEAWRLAKEFIRYWSERTREHNKS